FVFNTVHYTPYLRVPLKLFCSYCTSRARKVGRVLRARRGSDNRFPQFALKWATQAFPEPHATPGERGKGAFPPPWLSIAGSRGFPRAISPHKPTGPAARAGPPAVRSPRTAQPWPAPLSLAFRPDSAPYRVGRRGNRGQFRGFALRAKRADAGRGGA